MIMELVSFKDTRFGNWIVKLSHLKQKSSYVAVAFHLYNFSVIVRTFKDEIDVINFIESLGEKHE
jgi:hypothetical protein